MRINAFMPMEGRWKIVSIFAYSTKGVPGIEIKGLGRRGTLLKEKIVYLTRFNMIKMPLRKFVICIDLPKGSEVDVKSFQWLELPVLLLFWQMLEALPISKLEDCFTAGSVSSTGKIEALRLAENELCSLQKMLRNKYQIQMKYLASEKYKLKRGIMLIPLEKILNGKKLRIKS